MLEALALAGFVGMMGMTGWSLTQKGRSGLRIYGPLYLGRYIAEDLRPKLTQYLERSSDGRPYSLIKRSWVYRAAKGITTYEGFGTTKDLHASGTHTIRPAPFGLSEEEAPTGALECVWGAVEETSRCGIRPCAPGAPSAPLVGRGPGQLRTATES